MAKVEVSFKATGSGQALGQYESYVDIQEQGTKIHFVVPAGWTIQSINVYPSGDSGNKTTDIASLRGANADWTTVFQRPLPTGFSFANDNADTSTLVDNGASGSSYEYLIWIQDGDGKNDFIDPGMRNTF